jgi:hypothetical protein
MEKSGRTAASVVGTTKETDTCTTIRHRTKRVPIRRTGTRTSLQIQCPDVDVAFGARTLSYDFITTYRLDRETYRREGGSFNSCIEGIHFSAPENTNDPNISGAVQIRGMLVKAYTRGESGRLYLKPESTLHKWRHMWRSKSPLPQPPRPYSPPSRYSEVWEPWFPDVEDEVNVKNTNKIFCLILGNATDVLGRSIGFWHSLCLLPTDAENQFKRIGVCAWNLRRVAF